MSRMYKTEHQAWVVGFNQGYEQALLNIMMHIENRELKSIRKESDKKIQPRFTQTLNPKSHRYIMVDRETGNISHKADDRPYKNVPILNGDNKETG